MTGHIQRFIQLFGVLEKYSLIDVSRFVQNPEKGGKLESPKGDRDYQPHVGKPTVAEFCEHLDGKRALAIRGSLFGVIDIDPKNYETFDAVSWIDDNVERLRRARLLATVSKSGGVRLWRFMMERVPPTTIADDLLFWAESLDMSGCRVEIWPNRSHTITLPYFGLEDRTGRSFESFIGLGEEAKRTEHDLRYKNDGKTAFGDSRNGMIENESGFSKLVEYVPEINVRGATHRFEFDYKGKTVGVDGIEKLFSAKHIKEQLAVQAGVVVPGLTPRRWEQRLAEMFETRRQESYTDNIESTMLWVMNNVINTALVRGGGTQITNPSILFLSDFRVWLEKETRMLWYKGPLMANRIEKSGICGKPTPQKLADVTREAGGTVPKGGKNVPGYGTHRLHGLPCSDQLYSEILDADEGHRPPVIDFNVLDTRIDLISEVTHESAYDERHTETRRRIENQRAF